MGTGETTATTATKSLAFRFDDDYFQVNLDVILKDGKVKSISEPTKKFLDYLKDLNFLEKDVNLTDLCESEDLTLHYFSNQNNSFKNSFKIRTKAHKLGLKIILGESFKKRREASMKRAKP